MPAERTTVLYDRDCGFCVWVAAQLRTLDRREHLDFVPLQEAGTLRERPDLARAQAEHRLAEVLHVVRPDGSVRAGGAALAAVLAVLPGGWLLRPWLMLPGAAWLLDRAYRLAAAHRGRLAGLVGAHSSRHDAATATAGRGEGVRRSQEDAELPGPKEA